MSLRAELVRLGLRFFIKRMSGPETTVDVTRRRLALLGRLVPLPPRGTLVKRLDLDGVKAVSVATAESRGDRHVLYLHGGGHVAAKPALYRDFIWRLAAATRPSPSSSTIGSRPSIRIRRRSTMPSTPTGRCSPRAPIRGAWR